MRHGLPPLYVIEAARRAAMESPCAKSKRGAVLFSRPLADRCEAYPSMYDPNAVIISRGFNRLPPRFTCSGSPACRDACGKVCLHAEHLAIRAAGQLDDITDLELVHVKVVDGQVVAGGPPSCWQCSRGILDVGVMGVWLYQSCECDKVERLVTDTRKHADMCPVNYGVAGVWHYYDAFSFHYTTLRNCNLIDC